MYDSTCPNLMLLNQHYFSAPLFSSPRFPIENMITTPQDFLKKIEQKGSAENLIFWWSKHLCNLLWQLYHIRTRKPKNKTKFIPQRKEPTRTYIHEHLQYRMTLFAQTKIESFQKISIGKGERKVSQISQKVQLHTEFLKRKVKKAI